MQDQSPHCFIKRTKLQQLPNISTHQLANSQLTTHKLINLQIHQFKNLNNYFFILQIGVCLPPHSSENVAYKVGKRLLFLTLHAFLLVCFREQNLHFAPFCLSRMVANSYFFNSENPLFAPKNPLFNGCFAHFSHVFHGSKWFCLCCFSGYLCFSSCI